MGTEVIKPRSAADIAPGVVRTEAEKQKIEEEKRKMSIVKLSLYLYNLYFCLFDVKIK